MLRTERFFENRQRAAVERFGFGVVAHRPVNPRQVVEADGGVGMLQAERFFAIANERRKNGSIVSA